MSAAGPNPVPPIPPNHPSGTGTDAPLGRSTQLAIVASLAVLAALVGWRWYGDRFGTRPTEVQAAQYRVDLNRATRSDLIQVPGIGPGLADRILSHRDSRGKFGHVDELAGVNGIGPATLDKLRPWLIVADGRPDEPPAEPDRLSRKPAASGSKKPAPPSRIDLNRATLEELQALPGIGAVLAQRIVAERERKPFASVAELRRVSGIGAKKLEAVKGLVTVGE